MFEGVKAFVSKVKANVSAFVADPRTASAFKGFVVGFLLASAVVARIACEVGK